jgi:hypothetical protein
VLAGLERRRRDVALRVQREHDFSDVHGYLALAFDDDAIPFSPITATVDVPFC